MIENKRAIHLLLFLTFCITSCDYLKRQSLAADNTEIEALDTSKPVIITSYPGKIFPILFEAAFVNGTQAREGVTTYHFFKYDLGRIYVESGKIIACDPIVMHDASPFVDSFPLGKYPVSLAIAKTPNNNRVAFSRIVFSDSPVVKWEFALHNGQKPIALKDSTIYCYGVDAGTGIFIDSVSNRLFDKKSQLMYEDAFIKGLEKSGNFGLIHEFGVHNLAAFSAGYGDGCYATYIGRDREGKICKLLTDFQLVEWWKIENDTSAHFLFTM